VFKGGRRQEVAGAAPEEIDYDTFHEIVEQMS
jgi:chromosome condensin MukBEF complex kleisin-like MukF subunit